MIVWSDEFWFEEVFLCWFGGGEIGEEVVFWIVWCVVVCYGVDGDYVGVVFGYVDCYCVGICVVG